MRLKSPINFPIYPKGSSRLVVVFDVVRKLESGINDFSYIGKTMSLASFQAAAYTSLDLSCSSSWDRAFPSLLPKSHVPFWLSLNCDIFRNPRVCNSVLGSRSH